MRKSLLDFCLETGRDELLSQWDEHLNGPLTAADITYGSKRKVWWRCSLGHEWQAVVAARTSNGSGCPYCAGRKVLTGFNDLATREPLLAKQWHPKLNGSLTPEMVTPGSHRKVWWQCPDGHVWRAVIYSRSGPQKSGCPICAGRDSKRWLEKRDCKCMMTSGLSPRLSLVSKLK